MAESVVTGVVTDFWDDGKRLHSIGTLAIGASPGTYSTGGIACNFLTISLTETAGLGGPPLPAVVSQPTFVRVDGIAGYKYEYDFTNKKLIIRSSGLATGTIAEGDVTVLGGAAGTALGITADSNSGALFQYRSANLQGAPADAG